VLAADDPVTVKAEPTDGRVRPMLAAVGPRTVSQLSVIAEPTDDTNAGVVTARVAVTVTAGAFTLLIDGVKVMVTVNPLLAREQGDAMLTLKFVAVLLELT
jgi:hypothetical protein